MTVFLIAVLLAAQLLTYIFARSLLWQFALSSRTARRAVFAACFLMGNGLLLAAVFRVWLPLFRISALWLVSLMFVCWVAAAVRLLQSAAARLHLGQPEKLHRLLRIFAPAALAGIYMLALYNAYTPVVRHARIHIGKPLGRPVRVALASDTHLGVLFGARQLDKLAAIMRQEQPDIILLPGDLMDDNTEAYEAGHMQGSLKKLRAPLGVYATIGNHDVGYGARPQDQIITRALEDAGITVLTNRAVQIDGLFWVAGLPDQMLGQGRHSARSVLDQADTAQPVFLMDHRPDDVLQHLALSVDMQVSGHTHNGQIFPANLIVRRLSPLAYGHLEQNGRHAFTTSGYGFWGVPFRLGSQSEVWIIDITGSS